MSDLKKIPQEIYNKLLAPVPKEAIRPHPTKSYLSTIKAMYIVERLNDVFGVGRWTLRHEVVKYENDYVLMKGELVLLDYPDCIIPEQYGGHPTTGKNTELADGFKSAVTDILSKTASYMGIGMDVFKGEVKPPGVITNKNNTNPYTPPPKKDTPKPVDQGHNTTKMDQINYISEKIMEMTNADYNNAANMLETLSQFKTIDNQTGEEKLIKGFTSFNSLVKKASEARIKVIYGLTKKEYENFKASKANQVKSFNNFARGDE